VKDLREQYTKRDISSILEGLSVRTVQYYTDFGIVTPDISPSQGRGKTRIYSERNLVQFAMAEYMTELNVDLDTIKRIMVVLRDGEFVHPEYLKPNAPVEMFDSFFDDETWGIKKELLYQQEVFPRQRKSSKMISKGLIAQGLILPIDSFHVITGKKELVDFDPESGASVVMDRLLWLGNIKRSAVLDLLGMKSLLSTGSYPF
jgi:DNA-binding transcriptional MerR regulator